MTTNIDAVTALNLPMAVPLSEETQKYFSLCEEKLGLIPNVLKAYAFDDVKLQSFTALYNDLMLGPSGLSKLEREMIAVVVSSINRCFYCLTAHGAAVRSLSGDPVKGEQMVMNYRAADLSERELAILDFAVFLTEHPDKVTEEHRKTLRDAGLTDRDIWDVVSVVGFFNMSNRVSSATEMVPNKEYHSMAR